MSYIATYFLNAMLINPNLLDYFLSMSSLMYAPDEIQRIFIAPEEQALIEDIKLKPNKIPLPKRNQILSSVLVYEAILTCHPIFKNPWEDDVIQRWLEIDKKLGSKVAEYLVAGQGILKTVLDDDELSLIISLLIKFRDEVKSYLSCKTPLTPSKRFLKELCPQCKYRLFHKYLGQTIEIPTTYYEHRNHYLYHAFMNGKKVNKFKNLTNYSKYAERVGLNFEGHMGLDHKWITSEHIRRICRDYEKRLTKRAK